MVRGGTCLAVVSAAWLSGMQHSVPGQGLLATQPHLFSAKAMLQQPL